MRRLAIASLALATCVGLAGCSSSSNNTQTPTVATTPSAAPGTSSRSVSIQNMAFGPDNISIPAGAKVTWTNQDSVEHTVTFDSASIPSSGNLPNGASFSATFDSPGTFTYHCTIHPGMTGTVTVT